MTVKLQKSWLCLFFVLAAWVTESRAQLNTQMVRSTFSGTYTPITGTAATAAQADCGIATGIPLGFTFNYLGTNYTTIALASDGWASFTATACSGTNSALATTTAPNATMALWMDDLITSSVQYTTTGTPGSQVFTAQWTSLSYWTTSSRTINYQLKLYEGTNVIEFVYGGISGTNVNTNIAESASIGIDNTTGGPGNFIDAVSGSSFIYNGTLNSGQWPTQNYRFTPGAPTAIAAGTYNVGAGQTYTTLTEAVAAINHRGVAGAVTLNLTDAAYIDKTAGGNETFPIVFGPVVGTSATNTITLQGNGADLRYAGSVAGSWGNGSASGTMFASTAEPILGLCGTDYVTVNNVSLTALTGVVFGTNTGTPTRVERGLAVQNCGAANVAPVFVQANPGAQNNTFTNISITLDRNNTNTMAIDQGNTTTPSAATGANSGNIYRNLTIRNSHKGISLGGNATYPDIGCEIGTTACSTFNSIGDPATANDLGLSTSATGSYGIQVANQSGIKIYNNIIRNITTSGGQIDGISILTFQGTSEMYNNKIQTLRNAGTASTALVSGIRATHTTTGTHTLRMYNNSVSEILSGYTGAASATRASRGIFISGTGGATTQLYEISNNSVSLDASASPNISSTCFEIATTSGPVFSLRNNVFANFTGAQTGVANHMCLYSTSATAFGNTGTTSNYNDLYIDNATNGFTGVGNTTTYATRAAWNAAVAGMEANSVEINPAFGSNTSDLHSAAAGLNNTGTTNFAYVTADLDCAARTDNDMGAYNINSCSAVAGGTITPATVTRCAAQTYTMTATGATLPSVGLTYQWEVSTVGGGAGFTSVTGGSGATGTTYTTAGLAAGTYYYRLNVTCSSGPSTAYSNELVVTVNPRPTVTVNLPTTLYCIPNASPVALTATGADTYSWSPATGLSATTGASVNATPTGTTTYTVTGTNTTTGCTNTATSAITVAPAVVMGATTATPPTVCVGDNSVLSTSATTGGAPNQYMMTPSSGTFTPITGGTVITGGAADGFFSTAPGLPIGFNFGYNGTTYSNFFFSSNGFIAFTNTIGTAHGNILATSSSPVLAPLWDDLDASAAAPYTGGTASYVTTGAVGSRVLTVEWLNWEWNWLASANVISFQCKLYEADNHIEFVYQQEPAAYNPGTTGGATIGISGAAGNFLCLTNSSAAPGTSTTTETNNIAAKPATGQVYAFYPPVVSSYLWTANTTPDFLVTNNTATVNANGVTDTRTYTVTATNSFGCSATGTATVTAGVPLSASITQTPACSGQSFNLTAAVVGGGSPYTYAWADLDNGTTLPATQTVTVAGLPAGTYNYEVEITDGCGDLAIESIAVTVYNVPVAAATPTTAAACGGVAASLTGSATGGHLGGPYTYSWTPATGLSATNTASVSANPTVSTTYTLSATETATGCVGTTTAQVNVGTTVTVISTAANPPTVCSGSPSTLSAVAASAGGSVTVGTGTTTIGGNTGNPYRSGNGTGNQIKTQLVYTAAELTAAGITAGPIFGLGFTGSGTQSGTVANFEVRIGHTSATTLTTTFETTPTTLVFTQASFTPATGVNMHNFNVGNFVWDGVSNILVQTCQTNNIIGTATVSAYTPGATQNNHAASSATACSATTGATVTAKPIITFNVNIPIAATYTWNPGGITSTPAVVSPTTTTTYTVTATSAAGCTGTGTATVTIAPFSCTGITAAATRCGGQNFNVTVTHIGGGAPFTYTWSDGVGGTYASNDTVAVNLPAGTYNFTVTVNDNCGNTCTSSLPGVVVNYAPVASVTPPVSSICGGVPASISLTASATTNGTPGTYTYTWTPTAGLTPSNAATVSAAPTATTLYTVSVTEPATNCATTATAAIGVGGIVTMDAVTPTPSAVCDGGTVVLTASASTAVATYCTPSYTTGTGSGDYCTLVQITGTTLDNPSGASAAPYYTSYPATGSTTATLTAGTTYTIVFSAGTYTLNDFAAWIDYNNNGNLADTGEKLGQIDNQAAGPATGSFTFTVPLTANNGPLRLRVREADQAGLIDPCAVLTYGETEDYIVTIVGGLDPISYSWSPVGSLVSSTGASVTTTALNTTTTFNVTAVSVAGCTATGSTSVTVNPLPTADAGVDQSTCPSTAVALAATGTGTWTGGTGTFSDATSPTSTYTPAASEIGTTVGLTWTVVGVGACTDTDVADVVVSGYSTTAPAANGSTYAADYEVTDAMGWTSYYDDNGTSTDYCDDFILLSLQKNGNTIGAIGDPGFAVEVKGNGGAVNITPNSNYVQNPDWYVMDRYWEVTPVAQPTSDIGVRFYYTTADFNAVNNSPAPAVSAHTDMKFFKINGGAYNPAPSSGHAGIPLATAYNASGYWQYDNAATASTSTWAYGTTTTGHYGEYVIASFSGGGGGGGGTGGAFPIELLSFTGYNSGTENVLNWSTTSEVNFSHFDVMRSSDGSNYENIGFVNGQGAANTLTAYTLSDKTPYAGTNFYQLRMVDKDGSHAFSNVVNIVMTDGFSYSLYPNPSTGNINIETRGMEGEVTLNLMDALGRTVATHTWAASQLEKLDISALSKGVYFYEISNKGYKQQGRLILGE